MKNIFHELPCLSVLSLSGVDGSRDFILSLVGLCRGIWNFISDVYFEEASRTLSLCAHEKVANRIQPGTKNKDVICSWSVDYEESGITTVGSFISINIRMTVER